MKECQTAAAGTKCNGVERERETYGSKKWSKHIPAHSQCVAGESTRPKTKPHPSLLSVCLFPSATHTHLAEQHLHKHICCSTECFLKAQTHFPEPVSELALHRCLVILAQNAVEYCKYSQGIAFKLLNSDYINNIAQTQDYFYEK